jgi:hypothetical protein
VRISTPSVDLMKETVVFTINPTLQSGGKRQEWFLALYKSVQFTTSWNRFYIWPNLDFHRLFFMSIPIQFSTFNVFWDSFHFSHHNQHEFIWIIESTRLITSAERLGIVFFKIGCIPSHRFRYYDFQTILLSASNPSSIIDQLSGLI